MNFCLSHCSDSSLASEPNADEFRYTTPSLQGPLQEDGGFFEIPEEGKNAAAIYQLIHDELRADGQPQLNLASFVTTWMEDEAQQLANESINKNLINAAEYPHTEMIHQRVIEMIARLFHAHLPPQTEDGQAAVNQPGFIGTTTVGSSEAVMLALLAHKWNWRKERKAHPHRSFKDQPYLIIGTHTHACFAKFARYFDVGVKWICLEAGQYAISAEQVKAILEKRIVDDPQIMEECGYSAEEVADRTVAELVMAIGCVVGTTYTGDIDDVEGIDQLLSQEGWDIPIHVDGASGGFVLPFTQPEESENALLWDFRLPHVKSINVSNHKFGLVYPGLGTVIFGDSTIVPKELLIDINYLSGEMVNYSLNFSRASAGVVLQYYNFLRLGRAGYRRMIQGCLANAQYLAQAFQSFPALQLYFEVISKTDLFPVVVFRFKNTWLDRLPFTLAELAEVLKVKGWIVPVYPLPANAHKIEVMRVVVRAHLTREQAGTFLQDLEAAIHQLLTTPVSL